MNFVSIKPKKLYQCVIQQVKQMIYEGRLKKGDKLPTERELSALLGVSRTAIREAVSALEIIGIVESRHGDGIFVCSDPLKHNIMEPLSMLFMLEENVQPQLIGVRKMLEAECSYLAAQNARPEELAEMTRCIRDFEQNTMDQVFSGEVDRDFHFAVAKASGNILLYHLFVAISDVLERHIRMMRLSISREPENINRLLEQHQRIYQAICGHDAPGARRMMEEHIEFVKSFIE
ncbi:transcription regulator hth gntr [Lucifera butyrica]|uniref:Transcription regulator hth gntr n=1 Tax=Lucifera butyrica TaxID=1351585 RepID=A0A498RD25_9FIRM|nr:FadR/GntR family transcriptional regulator [Lucifera butyrica]VBB09454.1 transcription regulator hth gntr [Lucifera butyrica]